MQPGEFYQKPQKSLSHKVGGKMVHWALLCNRVAVESLACRILWVSLESLRSWRQASWEQCFAWCLASKEAEFTGCFWPRAGLPGFVLHTHSSPPPCLTINQGVVCDSCPHNFLFRARLWSHLPGSSFCWSLLLFRSTVITHTASQTDDSFQPWLISALWPLAELGSAGPFILVVIENSTSWLWKCSYKHTSDECLPFPKLWMGQC